MFYATSIDDLPTMDFMLEHTGLEFMQAMLDGKISAPPIVSHLNFALRKVDFGTTTFRGSPKFEALNSLRTVHGGWYGTALDSALGCAVMTTLPKGRMYTTSEFKVNLIRGLKVGVEVDIIGKCVHSGRSTAVATADIVGVEDGKLYATGSTTCLVMTPQS